MWICMIHYWYACISAKRYGVKSLRTKTTSYKGDHFVQEHRSHFEQGFFVRGGTWIFTYTSRGIISYKDHFLQKPKSQFFILIFRLITGFFSTYSCRYHLVQKILVRSYSYAFVRNGLPCTKWSLFEMVFVRSDCQS